MQTQAASGTTKKKVFDKHVRARRADERDAEVGRRIRTRRLQQGLSQTELADRIGVTFQQVQKYEKGVNRVGAGRLERISAALEVQPSYFFGDGQGGKEPMKNGEQHHSVLLQSRNSVRLLEALNKMGGRPRMARLLVEMAEEMVAE